MPARPPEPLAAPTAQADHAAMLAQLRRQPGEQLGGLAGALIGLGQPAHHLKVAAVAGMQGFQLADGARVILLQQVLVRLSPWVGLMAADAHLRRPAGRLHDRLFRRLGRCGGG